MEWYEAEVQGLEAARVSRGTPTHPPIFYGSSTIRLWKNLPRDLQCPEALNLGFGGSTLEACLYFFDRLIVPETPSSLVLYAGDNDIGDGRGPDQVSNFFGEFAAKLEATLSAVPFGFISIKPSPARRALWGRIQEANTLVKQQISHLKTAYFIDVFEAMLGPNQSPRKDLFEEDGLHMNKAGYQLWTRLLSPYRNQMFTPSLCGRKLDPVSSSEQ